MLTYISNSSHYKEVLSRVQSVKHTLWIGTVEIKEQYMRMCQFDYKKACCSVNDFEFEKLD